MSSLAIIHLSLGLFIGYPVSESQAVRDSAHQVVTPPAVQSQTMQVDARTRSERQLRLISRPQTPPYSRNIDSREGFTPALEERLEMIGPFIPRQEKCSRAPVRLNL
jgi:hypothetical protein